MIDYAELSNGSPPGEKLEHLTRMLLNELGITTEWTGRGADGGKDLLATEHPRSPIRGRSSRWIVSCKDFCKSGRTVSEADLPSVRDKLLQHDANAFLLVTTTTVGSAAKAMLEALNKGDVLTKVWDRPELDRLLLDPLHRNLLKQFFPKSYIQVIYREHLQSQLPLLTEIPTDVMIKVVEILSPYTGNFRHRTVTWPDNPEKTAEFEKLCNQLLAMNLDLNIIAYQSNPDSVDVLLRALNMLRDRGLEDLAHGFACALLSSHPGSNCSLVCFQFLLDFELDCQKEIHLCQFLSQESLQLLYFGEVACFLQDELLRNPSRVIVTTPESLDMSTIRLTTVAVESITFAADGFSVFFSGLGSIKAEMHQDRFGKNNVAHEIEFSGHFGPEGMFLNSVTNETLGLQQSDVGHT